MQTVGIVDLATNGKDNTRTLKVDLLLMSFDVYYTNWFSDDVANPG